jgi:hypothetical protein
VVAAPRRVLNEISLSYNGILFFAGGANLAPYIGSIYIVLILKLAFSTHCFYPLKGRHLKYFIFKFVPERKIVTLP